jgi:hypothetical protein
MQEQFSGWMSPISKRSLPDFAPILETHAQDLKRAADRFGRRR